MPLVKFQEDILSGNRPSEKEVLTSRLIDRPMRPLFPEGYYFETQVIASVLSADQTGPIGRHRHDGSVSSLTKHPTFLSRDR